MEYTPNDFFLARKRTIDATYGRLEKSEEIESKKEVQEISKSEVVEETIEEPTAEEMAKADAEFDLLKSIETFDKPFDLDLIKGTIK